MRRSNRCDQGERVTESHPSRSGGLHMNDAPADKWVVRFPNGKWEAFDDVDEAGAVFDDAPLGSTLESPSMKGTK